MKKREKNLFSQHNRNTIGASVLSIPIDITRTHTGLFKSHDFLRVVTVNTVHVAAIFDKSIFMYTNARMPILSRLMF